MNIIDIQDNLKNFSEQQLVSEMQSPSGNAPQFLVLSEIQRRKRVRDDFAKREAANEPTVAQEAIAAAGVPQSGVMGMREAMNPKRTMVQNMRSGGLMALGNDIQRGFSGKVDPFLDEVKGMAESRFDIDLDSQQGQNARMPMVDPSRALNNPRTPRVGAGKGGTPTPTAGGSAFGSPLTQDFRSRSSYANNNDFIRGIGSLMNVIPMKEGGVIKAQSGTFFNDGMPTEELLRAIMMQESGGDPKARGSLDEVGAFQIRPSTALLPVGGKSMFPELSAQIGEGKKYKNADEAYLDNKEMIDSALEDIGKSRQFAGDYLGALRSRAGSDEGAIAAYNRGLGGLKNVKDPSQLDYFKGVSSFMTEQDAPSIIDRGKDLASSAISGVSNLLSPKEAYAQGVSNPSLAMQGRPFGIIDVAPPETDTEISMKEEMDKKIAQYAETEEYKQYVERARKAGVKPKSPKERYAEITPNEEGVSPLDRFTLDTKDGGSGVVSVLEEGQGTIEGGGTSKEADEAVKKKQKELGLNVVKEFTSPIDTENITEFSMGRSSEDVLNETQERLNEFNKTKTESELKDDSLPVSSLEQQIIDLQNRLEKNREQDKYLALAQAGLAIMSSDSPTLAGAIGEGGVDGLKAFREANERYEEGVIDLINARAKLKGKTTAGLTPNQALDAAIEYEKIANDLSLDDATRANAKSMAIRLRMMSGIENVGSGAYFDLTAES
jgi:hypothetical protein|tara:strand:+ start:3396 stop:5555 length:2160 start_codon:yes stop_codon:yes gene_type:complete